DRCGGEDGLQALEVVVGGGDVGDQLEGLQVAVQVGLVLGDQVSSRPEQLGPSLKKDCRVAPGVLQRLGDVAQIADRLGERTAVFGEDVGEASVVGGQAVEHRRALHEHLAQLVAGVS